MTWNINFNVKDGAVDTESVSVGGTPPDGFVSVNGYETESGRSIAVNAAGAMANAYIPKPPKDQP